VPRYELFGTATCQYTAEMREWLEWKRYDFVEYDVDADDDARKRLLALVSDQRTVPVLVEDGEVVQIGWQGRSCVISG